jgi:hypothetical protein
MSTGVGAAVVRFAVPFCGVRNPQRALLSIAALGVLLTSCSGGSSKPQVLPTLTATPSATPAAVEIPAAATPPTAQGADAFVRFFFKQLNHGFEASDPEAIKSLSGAACSSCNNFIATLAASRAKGEFLRGDSFSVAEVAAPPLEGDGTVVDISGEIPPRDRVDANGRVLRHLDAAGPFHLTVEIARAGNGWVVKAMTKVGT